MKCNGTINTKDSLGLDTELLLEVEMVFGVLQPHALLLGVSEGLHCYSMLWTEVSVLHTIYILPQYFCVFYPHQAEIMTIFPRCKCKADVVAPTDIYRCVCGVVVSSAAHAGLEHVCVLKRVCV